MKYTVGQVLCAVITGHHVKREPLFIDVTITKIGRRWVEFEGWRGKGVHLDSPRFDMANGRIDAGGFNDIGRVYESRAAYDAMMQRQRAWSGLTAALRNRHDIPVDVTHDDIRQAAKLLGVELIHGS